jgi:cellulose synthase/poly-beta-1,6-N-acetylglucosamine synthase-like glycosyltransferase
MLQEIIITFLKYAAIYFFAINLIYGALAILSWFKIKKFKRDQLLHNNDELPGVSFIIPAFNEQSLIVETLQTYLSLPQKNKEIIVVNDGSHDQTFKVLQVMFQLKRIAEGSSIFRSLSYPELLVLESVHQGKAESLNAGIRLSQYDLICTMDADTIPTAHGVEAALRNFSYDSELLAAGGIIQVLNSPVLKKNAPASNTSSNWLISFQSLEYLRTFLCVRLGWSFLGSTSLISGAFCMLKKEAWRKVGGFRFNSITEDLDLIIRLRKAYPGFHNKFRIIPVTTCYTQVPQDKKHLMVQRMRWQMGLVETLSRHLDLIFHPGHGFLGLFAIPYSWLVEIISPLFEIIALFTVPFALIQGWIQLETVAVYLSLGLIFNIGITLFGNHLDNKHVSLFKKWSYSKTILVCLMFNLGYKQMTSWWRLLAVMKSFRKGYRWGEKPRQEIIHHPV